MANIFGGFAGRAEKALKERKKKIDRRSGFSDKKSAEKKASGRPER